MTPNSIDFSFFLSCPAAQEPSEECREASQYEAQQLSGRLLSDSTATHASSCGAVPQGVLKYNHQQHASRQSTRASNAHGYC